jgi:predicted amidohydrolase YtcJ
MFRLRGIIRVVRGAPADRIFFGGDVVTVDARDSLAEAVAVRDGRIAAVADGMT